MARERDKGHTPLLGVGVGWTCRVWSRARDAAELESKLTILGKVASAQVRSLGAQGSYGQASNKDRPGQL